MVPQIVCGCNLPLAIAPDCGGLFAIIFDYSRSSVIIIVYLLPQPNPEAIETSRAASPWCRRCLRLSSRTSTGDCPRLFEIVCDYGQLFQLLGGFSAVIITYLLPQPSSNWNLAIRQPMASEKGMQTGRGQYSDPGS